MENQASIIFKFNLSGGKDHTNVYGLTMQSLDKFIGKSLSTWPELEEVLLDVEGNLNNQPLTYIVDDLEYLVLTPNSMILGRLIKLPDDFPEEEEVCNNWKK